MPALLPEVLTKDSDVWLDEGRPPQNTFANIRKLKLVNRILMIYDQATKLFSDGNSIVRKSANLHGGYSRAKIHFQV
jgi:hypothetical protein